MQQINEGRGHRMPMAVRLFALVVGTFFFLCMLTEGTPPAGDGLDASYSAVLGWAMSNGLDWGRDIVFTFGPLGYFPPHSPYLPDLYPAYIAAQFALAAAIGLTAAHVVAVGGTLARLGMALVMLLWLPWLAFPQTDGIWYGFFGLSAVALAFQAERGSQRAMLAWSAFYVVAAATLSLTKFTLWPLSLVWLLAVTAVVGRTAGFRWGIAVLAGYAAVTVAWWLACGQTLSALPDYVATAMQLVEGYGPAMASAPAQPVFDVVGMATLVIGGGWSLWCLISSARAGRWDRAAVFFLLGGVLYFAWRASYTRADEHVRGFLVTSSLVAVAATALASDARRVMRWTAAAVLLALPASLILLMDRSIDRFPVTPERWTQSASLLVARAGHALDPMRGRAEREAQWREATANRPFPKTRAMVGDDTIDLLSFKQGLMLLGGFNYRMRPVFQSYTVYTPRLQRINEAFFEGPRAPRWVLMELATIDGRLPMAEDAGSQLAVLRHYEPVLREDGFVLLRKRPDPALAPRPPARWRQVGFGEWVDVPAEGAGQLAHVDMQPSLAGKIGALAFREPVVLIEVENDQRTRSTFRFVRTQAREGVLLSPLMVGTPDWLAWYTRTHANRVRRVRFTLASPKQAIWFRPEIRVGFSELPDPRVAQSRLPAALDELRAAGFNVRPSAREGDIRGIEFEGEAIMFMHSPSSMRFDLAPAHYRIDVRFGVRADAPGAEGCEQADGIRLSLYRTIGSAREVLARHDLNPFAPVNGPADARLEGLVLQLDAGEQLELAMEQGPANTACDWGYVRDLRITPVPASTPVAAASIATLQLP